MTNYVMSASQMADWKQICRVFAKKHNAKVVFVDNSSCGLENKDGSFSHIYIDEMLDILKREKNENL